MFRLLPDLTESLPFQGNQQKSEQGQSSDGESNNEDVKEERVISLRPLNMEDFRQAKNQVTFFLINVNVISFTSLSSIPLCYCQRSKF